eukprot:gene10647-12431_t
MAQDVEMRTVSGEGQGRTYAVISTAAAGKYMDLEKLIAEGHDVNEADERGLTAAHQAAFYRRHEALGELIRLGANLNAQDNDGWTPLMTAASTGDSVIVQQLLDGNAHPLIQSKERYMAHSYAKFGQYPELAHRIANVALERAIALADFFSIFYLLEDGADVNTQTLPGATALIVAAHAGQAEVVRRLLTVPNIHPDFQEKDGWTALMFAAYSGNVDIVYMLLDHGIDMGVQNVQGMTALDVAKQFNQAEVAHILEQRSVQVMQYQAHAAAERAREEIAAQEYAHQAYLHAQAEAQATAQRQAEEQSAQEQAVQQAQRANAAHKSNNAGAGTSAAGPNSAKEAPTEPAKKSSFFGW